MSDLVKHLRSAEASIKMPDGSVQLVNHAAADRIEQLETELRLCQAERKRAQKACEQIAERTADRIETLETALRKVLHITQEDDVRYIVSIALGKELLSRLREEADDRRS